MDRTEVVRAYLVDLGLQVEREERVNDAGTQLRCRKRSLKGPIINLWDNGNVTVQGQCNLPGKTNASLAAEIKAIADADGPAPAPSRDVFVVYGHDQDARDQLEALLQRWDLNPLFLDRLPSAGQTIIEKLERYQGNVGFAIVLLTPDDVGHAKGQEANAQPRARQNVVLELGMLIGRLGRSRVAVLYRGPLELPSDINGLMYTSFSGHVRETKESLFIELAEAGISVDPTKVLALGPSSPR